MSMWYSVNNKEDVGISEDGKSLEILFKSDHNGNSYIEVPTEFIKEILEALNEKTNENQS